MTTIIEIDDIGSLVEKMAATEKALKRALERSNRAVVGRIRAERVLERTIQRSKSMSPKFLSIPESAVVNVTTIASRKERRVSDSS